MTIRLVKREDAAAIAGYSVRYLAKLDKETDGPPWTGKGYDAERFGAWLRERWRRDVGIAEDGQVYNYEQERARLTKAQADRTELEAAELRGELVRVADLVDEWGRMLGAVRSRLLSLPSKAAPRARGAVNDDEAATLIEVEVLEALEELSADGLPDRTRARRERIAGRAEAAAEADGERMGRRGAALVAGKRGRAG